MGPGRPTLYDDDRALVILEALAAGNTRECAADLAGIGKRTLTTWIAKGRDGEEPFSTFTALIKNAERQAEAECVGVIRKAARDGTWQAAAWYLERKFGETWAKDAELVRMLKDQREQAEDEGQQLDLSKLNEEQLQILNTWLAGEDGPPSGEPDTVLE